MPDEKLVFIPNWVDIEWIRPFPCMNRFRTSVGVTADDFLVMYGGNFGYKQQMETVVEAASHRLDNVPFLGVQPRDLLPEMLAASDPRVLHQRTEVVDTVVPSKLLTYSASARPILLAGVPGSEGTRFVTDSGSGRVIQPEDPRALARAIAAMDQSPDKRRRLAAHA